MVGFNVMWVLDNSLPCDKRKYTIERVNLEGVNVMLDVEDATRGLKLAPDGLEARNDALSFESCRATCSAQGGGPAPASTNDPPHTTLPGHMNHLPVLYPTA